MFTYTVNASFWNVSNSDKEAKAAINSINRRFKLGAKFISCEHVEGSTYTVTVTTAERISCGNLSLTLLRPVDVLEAQAYEDFIAQNRAKAAARIRTFL